MLRVSRRRLAAEGGDGGEGRGGCRWGDGVPRPQRPIRGFAPVDEMLFQLLEFEFVGGKVFSQRKAQITPFELINFLNHKKKPDGQILIAETFFQCIKKMRGQIDLPVGHNDNNFDIKIALKPLGN